MLQRLENEKYELNALKNTEQKGYFTEDLVYSERANENACETQQ